MKLFRVVLIASLFAAGFAFFPAQEIASAECVSIDGGDAYFDLWGPYTMAAGTVIDFTLNTEPSNGTYVGVFHNGAFMVDYYAVGPLTYSYTMPTDASDVFVSVAFEFYYPSNNFSIRSGCAGRDMVAMPDQAVVGTFVANTELLSMPSSAPEAGTGLVMEIGQSLWVYGVDSSGMYYKVLMSGNLLWVPVSSIGPNYDEVWNGTPLPTTVVG